MSRKQDVLWSPERIGRLETLLAQGAPRARIARELGVTPRQLSVRLWRMRAREQATLQNVVIAVRSVTDASLREICESLAAQPALVNSIMREAKIGQTVRCPCAYDAKRVARMRASLRRGE